MKAIQDRVSDRIMEQGYNLMDKFLDASDMYTFMEENDMAKNGNN